MKRFGIGLKEDLLKDLSEDSLGNNQGYEEIIGVLCDNPGLFASTSPPAGYEENLLARLRMKTASRSRSRRFWATLLKPQLVLPRWSLALSICMLVFTTTWFAVRDAHRPSIGLSTVLVDSLKHVDGIFARRWLASVGEPLTVAMVENDDPAALAIELESSELRKALNDLSGLVPQRIRK